MRSLLTGLIGSAVLLAAGCGDSPLPPTPAGETTQSNGVGAGLPPDSVGVYLAARLRSDSTVYRDAAAGALVLESSQNGVVLLDLAGGAVSLVDATTSPSYAANTTYPVTSGDQLFMVTEFESGAVSYDEFDPRSGTLAGPGGRTLPGGRVGQYAFAGDLAYFIGSDGLSRAELTTGDRTSLGRVDLTAGDLLSWAGLPFYATTPFADDPFVEVFALQASAGQAARSLVQGRIDAFEDYVPHSFQHAVLDEGSVYWVAAEARGYATTLELWHYDVAGSGGEIELVAAFDVGVPGVSAVPLFDVDHPHVAVNLEAGDDDHLVVYRVDTGVAQIFELDISPYGLAVLDDAG